MLDIKNFLINEDVSLREAFMITSRLLEIAFVVDKNGDFKGVITDGDIRKALINGAVLDEPILKHYNRNPIVCDNTGKIISPQVVPNLESPKVYIFPVVEKGKVIGYKTYNSIRKVAFISGVTGQDGAYLAYFLLKNNYKVIGGYRRASSDSFQRLRRLNILDKIDLVSFDLLDLGSMLAILEKHEPTEVYNLAAQSFVHASFSEPLATFDYNLKGPVNMLEAIRRINPKIRFYQASSSEMYGRVQETPQKETTPFYPLSPYATSKLAAHWATINYRQSYDIFACLGILFNHESPLRGTEFVTRKITYEAAKIKLGLADKLYLGNLKAKRDWGYAYDYVKAMWLMLQQDEPDDYVVATGKSYSVGEFVAKTFAYLGLDPKKHVLVDDRYYRPNDVDFLLGDAGKARQKLGWQTGCDLDRLVKLMVDADLDLLKGNNILTIAD